MQKIAITRGGDLDQRVWSFWFEDRTATLWLDEYLHETRPTWRHKFQPIEHYTRLARRGENNIALEDVPLFDSVMNDAKDYFMSMVTVKKWEER